MGFLSRFEGKMEDTFEGAADRMANAPISPVQIAKKAEKQMRREKMVGAGKQYAPTLYTVLVNPDEMCIRDRCCCPRNNALTNSSRLSIKASWRSWIPPRRSSRRGISSTWRRRYRATS